MVQRSSDIRIRNSYYMITIATPVKIVYNKNCGSTPVVIGMIGCAVLAFHKNAEDICMLFYQDKVIPEC
jgi:hypothetical protein